MNLRKRRIAGTAAALTAAATLTAVAVQGTAGAAEADVAYCSAQVAFDTALLSLSPGDPQAAPTDMVAFFTPLLDELEATAPEAITAQVGTLTGILREGLAVGDEAVGEAFSSPEFAAADAEIDRHLLANCGFNQIVSVGSEYMFEGIPDAAAAGPTAVTFTNVGEEFHMVVLGRFNDGETMTAEELLALPQDQLFRHARLSGDIFLPPGRSDTAFYDLVPGRYFAACFMPVGAVPGAPEPEGEPAGPPQLHFMEGMLQEFNLS